jgi:hypothetical protein
MTACLKYLLRPLPPPKAIEKTMPEPISVANGKQTKYQPEDDDESNPAVASRDRELKSGDECKGTAHQEAASKPDAFLGRFWLVLAQHS